MIMIDIMGQTGTFTSVSRLLCEYSTYRHCGRSDNVYYVNLSYKCDEYIMCLIVDTVVC